MTQLSHIGQIYLFLHLRGTLPTICHAFSSTLNHHPKLLASAIYCSKKAEKRALNYQRQGPRKELV